MPSRGGRRVGPIRTIALLIAGVWVLAACTLPSGSPQPDTSVGATTANQQDAIFATQLIELNEQLVAITDILAGKTDDVQTSTNLAELERVANERIILAKGWLQRWGRTAVEAPEPPGTLTEKQLDVLVESNGPKLAAGIASAASSQLNGAREISESEVAGGENSRAKQVAEQLLVESEEELSVLLRFVT